LHAAPDCIAERFWIIKLLICQPTGSPVAMPFFDLPQTQLEAYRSSAVAPADFDSFWVDTLELSREREQSTDKIRGRLSN